MSKREIWLAVESMIRRYGQDAALQAALRGDEVMAEGDVSGYVTWKRIMLVIEELQTDRPVAGQAIKSIY